MVESKDSRAKVVTVRVSPEEAQRAEMLARVEDISVNEVFRRGLECYFEQKRSDVGFVDRARTIIARDAALVSEL